MLSFEDFTKYKELDEIKLENQLLNMLTATITHELKTPLNCIISFTGMALQAHSNYEYFIKLIRKTAQFASLEVSDALDHTTLTKGRFTVNLQSHNVAELVGEVVEMMAFQARLKNLEIVCRVQKVLNTTLFKID